MANLLKSVGRRGSWIWGLADQALVSGSNFACSVVLARSLGLQAFGVFSLAWMAILFASLINDALVVYPMLTLGPKQEPGERARYFGAVIALGLLISLVVFCAVLVVMRAGAALSVSGELGTLALPLAGSALLFLIQNVLRYYFFTCDRPAAACLGDAISYVGKLVGLLALAGAAALGVRSALWVSALTSGLAVAASYGMLGEVRWDPDALPAIAARHWRFGKWLAGSALLRWAESDLFTWMAGGLLGTSAVGGLRAAQTITNLLLALFAGLESVVTPRAASRYHMGGATALYDYMRRVGLWVGIVAGVLILVMLIAPGDCLRLLYGPTYSSYGALLRWLALSQALVFLMFLSQVIVRTLEATKVLILAGGATAALNLLTSRPLLGGLGAEGAAIGVVLGRGAWLAVLLLALLCSRRVTPNECAVDPI